MLKQVIIDNRNVFTAWLEGCPIEYYNSVHRIWHETDEPFTINTEHRIQLPRDTNGDFLKIGEEYKDLGIMIDINKDEIEFKNDGWHGFAYLHQQMLIKISKHLETHIGNLSLYPIIDDKFMSGRHVYPMDYKHPDLIGYAYNDSPTLIYLKYNEDMRYVVLK